MKVHLLLMLLSCPILITTAQNVYIPDIDLKYELIELGIDTNEDNEISYSEAEAVNNLDVSSIKDDNIEPYTIDFTGLEAFINLDTFDCSNNHGINLNVSGITSLLFLDCSGNH